MALNERYIEYPLEKFPKDRQKSEAKVRVDEFIRIATDLGGFHTADRVTNPKTITTRKQRNALCRRLWDNSLDDSRFDYLYHKVQKKIKTKEGGKVPITLQLPGRVRRIPIVRPKIQALISKEKERPLIFRSYAYDDDSIQHRKQLEYEKVVEEEQKRIDSRLTALKLKQQLISMQRQMIEQQYATEQQGFNPLIAQIQAEMESLSQVISQKITLNQDELRKVLDYYQYSFKSTWELVIDNALQDYIDRHDMRGLFNKGFIEQNITDEEVYFCHWYPGMEEPETHITRGEYLFYQYNELAQWIGELDWGVEYMPTSIGNARASLGKWLGPAEMDEVLRKYPTFGNYRHYNSPHNGNLTHLPDGTPVANVNENEQLLSQTIDIWRVFWKEQTEVYALVTKNKHEANFSAKKEDFISFIPKEKALKLLKNPKKLEKKGQRVERRYRNDLWEAIRIGKDMYVRLQKCPYQYRNTNKKGDVMLPWVGRAVNIFERPNSLIWETREVQELYDILHFHEEVYISLSGVKGIIYDLSQKPENMSMQEVLLHAKQGIMPIKTVGKGGRRINTSFNQFQTFDHTLPASIQHILGIKASLENMVSMITGITGEQIGQLSKGSQVGTTRIALQQSNVVTEHYFQRHEEVIQRVLQRLANIFPQAYKNGRTSVYHDGRLASKILSIPKGGIKEDIKMRTRVSTSSKERDMMQKAVELGGMKLQQGQLSASAYLEMMGADTLSEMIRTLKHWEDRAMEMMEAKDRNLQQGQQMQLKAQQEFEAQMKQLDAQNAMQLEQLKGQIDLQIQSLKQQSDAQKAQMQEAGKMQLGQLKDQTDRMKINREADTELKYLGFQYDELAINNKLKTAQLILDRGRNAIEIEKSRSKERVKD